MFQPKVKAALAAAHLEREIFGNTFTPIVLNTGGKRILSTPAR
jgi:hypothetical protein